MPPSGANLLAECLYRHGTRHVFGMPGSHSTFIYDAIHQRGLQTILCRNEQAGAFMADGYARSTGRPGVVCTTAGPGATNALTGIAESFSDSVPVLLIAGQVNHDRIHQSCGRYHEIDLEGIFRPCVRFAATVMNNEQIPGTVNRAFESMTAGRPGPAALFLPQDLMAAHTMAAHTMAAHTMAAHTMAAHTMDAPAPAASAASPAVPSHPSPSDEIVRSAAELLLAAKRPVILAGGGAVSSGAAAQVEQLARLLGCPIVTTLNGKGIVDERSPCSLGHGRTRRARMVLSRADVMLAVGCRFTEIFTASGTMTMPKTLLQIDIDPNQIGMNYKADVGIAGDARIVLEAILALLAPREDNWAELWQRVRSAEQLKPEWLIERLRAELPESALVFADASEMGLRMQSDFPAYAPRTFFYPSNYATLGWGLPAAIGGAVGQPERRIACVCGDGGFLMTAQEISTAMRYKLNIIVIVHNDSTYGAIKLLQRARHEARYVDVDLNNPDFVKFGESFGVPSCRARAPGELAAALRQALQREGPSLIEVPDVWRSLRN